MSALSLDMKVKAIQFRQEHRFSPTEPIKIDYSLAALGVLAVFKPLGESFSGMAIKEHGIPAMVVNSKHAVGRHLQPFIEILLERFTCLADHTLQFCHERGRQCLENPVQRLRSQLH